VSMTAAASEHHPQHVVILTAKAPAATAVSVFVLTKKHKKLMTCELPHSCSITYDGTKLPCPKTCR